MVAKRFRHGFVKRFRQDEAGRGVVVWLKLLPRTIFENVRGVERGEGSDGYVGSVWRVTIVATAVHRKNGRREGIPFSITTIVSAERINRASLEIVCDILVAATTRRHIDVARQYTDCCTFKHSALFPMGYQINIAKSLRRWLDKG